jgi:erythromycin esterase-like protein
MSRRGELNLGQLVCERYGDDAFLVGFSTHDGTVTAAHDWDGPAERMQVRPSLPGSLERTMHETGHARALVLLREREHVREALAEPRLERAIGVIYRPETERWSHYVEARVAEQFDALLHFDRTRAVEPLDRGPGWRDIEPPEAYPWGV